MTSRVGTRTAECVKLISLISTASFTHAFSKGPIQCPKTKDREEASPLNVALDGGDQAWIWKPPNVA